MQKIRNSSNLTLLDERFVTLNVNYNIPFAAYFSEGFFYPVH